MSSVNKVILVGNVGKMTSNETPSGMAATIQVATSETWVDKTNGEKKTSTEWHRVVCYGDMVNDINSTVKIGSIFYVEGHLKTRKHKEKLVTEIIVDAFKVIAKSSRSDAGNSK